MRLVIVTGMSGAGKTIALKNLEDMGFYCVDNLPILLIEKFAELILSRRNEHEDIIEEAINRYKENSELYRMRQQLVEHPFGTMKRILGFTHFLTQRLENVKTENYLHVITYNLKRVLSIFRVPELVEQLNRIKQQSTDLIDCISNQISIFSTFFCLKMV